MKPGSTTVLCRPGERIDDLQRNGLRILQDPARFCFGMDAVLLSAYVQMKKAKRGLDLGTGNGIIPILLSDRTDCAHLTGLEIQPASADLAARSVALNGLEDRISIVRGDIREADSLFPAASFDLITCNPPYRKAGSGRVNGNYQRTGSQGRAGSQSRTVPQDNEISVNVKKDRTADGREDAIIAASGNGDLQKPTDPETQESQEIPDPRAIARHEILCTFDDVARAASRLLRPGGHFYLVHRPLRLAEIISTLCAAKLEPKRMRLVYPHVDEAPNMVLLDCVRGAASELRVEPPLIVYEKDGTYTPDLMEIYYGT